MDGENGADEGELTWLWRSDESGRDEDVLEEMSLEVDSRGMVVQRNVVDLHVLSILYT